jgi:hypothetical protein
MAWTEDPTDFLEDFGVSVTANGTTGLGILDMPGEYVADGRVITNEYLLRAEASKFGSVTYGDSMTVAGVAYEVREAPLLVDDGVFCLVLLTKLAVVLSKLLLEDGFDVLLEDSSFLLLEA